MAAPFFVATRTLPRYRPGLASGGVRTVSQKRRATDFGMATVPLGMMRRGAIV